MQKCTVKLAETGAGGMGKVLKPNMRMVWDSGGLQIFKKNVWHYIWTVPKLLVYTCNPNI